ncbi:MAG: FAD-dependent oxidoreductase [Deltaproteobacteria bacterium]|nr:FAD-dependent oxidoreductase [Deltaproteobacteria bacterium]
MQNSDPITNTSQPAPVGKPVGAIMVSGAGIAGMQAALDLANSGFKVYLVEALSAIGGKMALLDKTFPTNDCAMCIVSPKLVEVGRHENIEILTNTQLEELNGSVGHFKAKLRREARYIRLDKCTGCGECVKNCPIEVIDEHNLGMSVRRAVYKRYPQAIPGAFAIDKAGRAPCKQACPAHISVQGYVALIAEGRFSQALALIRRDNPFPSVCGRVCPAPCETACSRSQVDQPIAIRQLKRFVADYELRNGLPELDKPEASRSEKVAIVGGGPSGLSAANYLRLKGFKATVFEALPKLGGMLRYGIPEYRLPRKILDTEIQAILDLGIEVEYNKRFTKDFTIDSLKKDGFQAIYLSTGAWIPGTMRIEGEDLEGVVQGIDFLGRAELGKKVEVGRKVVVIGGGNTAIDAARTAVRLGAEQVTVLYRRSRAEMPAEDHEIEAAIEEGIQLHFLAAPKRCLGNAGKLTAIEYLKMELGEPDASGRRRPIPIEGSETQLPVDTLLEAIGQWADLDFLPEPERKKSPTSEERGWLVADPVTLETTIPSVFAGGDLASGAATAIEAIAAGKEAAISIERYLLKQDIRSGRPHQPPVAEITPQGVEEKARVKANMLDKQVRSGNFDEVEECLTEDQAVAEAKRCLACGICCECYQCVEACEAGAIDHDQLEETLEVEVGSVILAPGFEVFDAEMRPEFGYGHYKNVMTSLEFERLLSASGPTEGHVKRPSDGQAPKKVAFIQCVGSRDQSCDRDYCSSVCCMYATKEAVIAREHDNNIEPTIFYIDLRAFGKGFDDYATRAREVHGVRFERAMISRVFEDPQTDNLSLRYIDQAGKRVEEEFDLVVLSVGLQIPEATKKMAARLNVEIDRFGFAITETFQPLATNRAGVFACGVFNAPKDIPETVSEASGAAGAAAVYLSESRGSLIAEQVYPAERQLAEDEPLRIGVFVCHCGINIAAIVDVEHVAEYALTLPGVVYSDHLLYSCSQDTQESMREIIKEHNLNRVVVASCSPRTHESLFQQTLAQAGLNKYLFDMANIRDQCSWVHRSDNKRATEKSKRLMRMAVANVSRAEPLVEREFEVDSSLLIIGGGLAGMTATLHAARQGFRAHLVERESQLGGQARNLRRSFDGRSVGDYLRELEGQLEAEPNVRIYRGSEVVTHTGFIGNFETEIMTPAGVTRKIVHGAILIATGGYEARPELYGLNENDAVISQTDFEKRLYDQTGLGATCQHVVMVQCAGSRDENQPYCSRVCCNQAIKNALAFKQRYPETRVDILYRDIRSYGLSELSYLDARNAGVNFIRFDPETNPLSIETTTTKLRVELEDPSIRRKVILEPDLLVLSTGIKAHDNEELGTMLRVPRAENGFFIEAHAKLRPVDFSSEGAFLAGLAHGPKNMSESIAQASAAVARAATILSKDKLKMSGVVSEVSHPERCAVCLTCVRACPYGVPTINEDHVAEINAAMCQGCGTCVAECPGQAISLGHFKNSQILAKIDAFSETESRAKTD